MWLVVPILDSTVLQDDETSQSQRKSVRNVHWKDWCQSWSSNILATWCKELTHWKRPWCWERLRARGKQVTEDKMVGWHHRLDGHKFVQAPGVGDGQGSLACCSPRGCKESDTTERLNKTREDAYPHLCGNCCTYRELQSSPGFILGGYTALEWCLPGPGYPWSPSVLHRAVRPGLATRVLCVSCAQPASRLQDR